MKWIPNTREAYQTTSDGRAHATYYIYKVRNGQWKAGRVMFNRDVDFRLDFSSAKVARDYIATYDREAVIIEAVSA